MRNVKFVREVGKVLGMLDVDDDDDAGEQGDGLGGVRELAKGG
jgi:hypothetical protein